NLENNLDDAKYYNAVIKLLLENEHVQISQKEKEKCISKLKDTKMNLLDDSFMEKKKCFLKDIMERFEDSYNNTSEIDSLSMLYDVPVEEVDNILVPEIIIDKYSIDNRNRVLTKDFIISIDGENTSEVDDALSCKRLENGNYLLGIHIADVFGQLSINDPVIYEAMNRATAIHLPGILIPMFPNRLAKNDLSLMENVARYADTHYFEITQSGEIIWDRMMESITYNDKRVTYDFVNSRLEKIGCDPKSELDRTILNLQKVANILEHSVFSYVDSSSLNVNTDAAKIVLYTMLLENTYQAMYASSNGYPLIYRTQTMDNKELVKEASLMFKDADDEDVYRLCSELEKTSIPAIYSNTGSHDGLRINHYCHFTSPIRRFADLWNRYLNKKYRFRNAKDKEIIELAKETDVVIDSINHQMKNVEYFTNDYNKYLIKK
ncbi:MAG: RNB domain-containing ribonuclease, partial [Bacilli bacterium]|nr:RNB domain-containing ribonuclease [Bacilli bacterium]